MQLYAGLDLHSRNTYIGIMDKEFKRLFGKRVLNKLPVILDTLAPFRDQLKGIVVESTFNWYWLIDGLMGAGYQCVHLANPSAMKQYEGIKHTDDQHDALCWKSAISVVLPRSATLLPIAAVYLPTDYRTAKAKDMTTVKTVIAI